MATQPIIVLISFAASLLHITLSSESLQWSDISIELQMPTAIALSAHATTNDSLYIFGGTKYSSDIMITDINVYRPKSTTPFFEWVTLTEQAPDALYCGSECAVTITDSSSFGYPHDSLIFIVAPYYQISGNEQYGDVFIFNTITDQWVDDINIAQIPNAVNRACVAYDYDGNEIYAIGGFAADPSVDMADYVQIYNISNNVWISSAQSDIESYPLPIAYSACIYYNDFVYVFAGQTKESGNFFTVPDVYKYSIAENQWMLITNEAIPSMRYLRVMLASNGKIYVISGFNKPLVFENVYVFDPLTDTFTEEPHNVYDNHGVAGAYITDLGGRITVFGGVDDNMNSLSTGRQSQILNPSSSPTSPPFETATNNPSNSPTYLPSVALILSPTAFPTLSTTLFPTLAPTLYPTLSPTSIDTLAPTSSPTAALSTELPTSSPVESVILFPSLLPTKEPLQPSLSISAIIPTRQSSIASTVSDTVTSSQNTDVDDSNKAKIYYNPDWIMYGIIGCVLICCIIVLYVICATVISPKRKVPNEAAAKVGMQHVVKEDIDESVKSFLTNLGQAKYIEAFAANEIYSMNVVKVLSENDVKEMIDKIGARRVILNAIQQLNENKEADNRNIAFKRYLSPFSHQSTRNEGEPKLLPPVDVSTIDKHTDFETLQNPSDNKHATAGVGDDEFVVNSDSEDGM